MKLWIIIVLAGQFGGTLGPLPTKVKADCDRIATATAEQSNLEYAAKLNAGGAPAKMPDGRVVKPGDLQMYCVASETRPTTILPQ